MQRFRMVLGLLVTIHVAFASALASSAMVRGTSLSAALPVGFVALWLAAFVTISGYLAWADRAVTVRS
ncbi:MAG: hypothetical protein QOF60_166 [Actinomycetota bacterium]|jgi:hypothetical protein|nr:hypothetical protein [Actinomycetota bacterium]